MRRLDCRSPPYIQNRNENKCYIHKESLLHKQDFYLSLQNINSFLSYLHPQRKRKTLTEVV